MTTDVVPTNKEHVIEVTFAGAAGDIAGAKGMFARSNAAKRLLDYARTTPGAHKAVGGMLQTLSATGDGLSYSAVNAPKDFTQAISGIQALYQAAVAEIGAMKAGTTDSDGLNRVVAAQALLAGAAI